MVTGRTNGRYERFVAMGTSGKQEDVDLLMNALASRDDMATSRLVDFALGMVTTREGTARVRHYLFNGDQRQRNYAALYFKRRGHVELLDDAVALGKIDGDQAYSQ